ncbi:MAG TPA: hypothetical protein VLL56_08005, partial [Terriglobia bacterium]|nr:hypothetical protein [Terriglobia bacterium]
RSVFDKPRELRLGFVQIDLPAHKPILNCASYLVNELVNRLSWPGVHLNEVRDPETKGPNRALRWRTPRQTDGNHDTPSRVANTVLLKSAPV